MIFMVLLLQAALSARCEEPPAPPQNVHVENWLLTWSPPPDDTDVTYTVHSSSHGSAWTDVPACEQMSSTSCDVALTAAKSKHGCVMLRVRTERRGLTSTPVPACSTHGDSCSPQVSLSARPGSLTVHLTDNHSLALKYADHAQHRVHYIREGDTLQHFEDSSSSLTLRQLQEGQRYCTQVHFILHSQAVGPPSCSQCELIPQTGDQVNPGVIVAVVFALFLLFPLTAYIFLYQRKRIKQCLRPPYEISEDFSLQRHIPISTCSPPPEERYDVISCVILEERRES
uniref:interferon gamma receptor 2 isoform X2 n=1 Tax=Semicossyphus pulcher TaxID=241346 RepID=UPI0037E74D1B